MDIAIKIYLILWVLSATAGTILFYCPGTKCKKWSIGLGAVTFLILPVIGGLVWIINNIWS